MVNLRHYQKSAADELEKLLYEYRCGYLSGEVRTGKTLTVLEVVRRMNCDAVLLVTKKKAIPSIKKDCELMGLEEIVTVINFEQVHKWATKTWDILIVDEAHGVGAYPKPSKRFKDLCRIRSNQVLLMSGTPSPESYSQLFHQFKLTKHLWHRYSNFYRWADEYVTVTTKRVGTGQEINDYSGAKRAKILEDIAPYTVRMTQKEAGFKTEIKEEIHTVRMKPRTYRLALRIIRDGVIGNPKGRSVVADTGAKVMGKLRQIYNGHVITENHGTVIWDYSKAEYIQKTFKGRLAIMYCYQAEGVMLRKIFGKRSTDNPEIFNANPDSVFIGQIHSCREGINLSSADDLCFLGIDYSALSYLQGRDRCSFLGRTRENRVHYIFAERSIEPRVYTTVISKKTYTTSHFYNDREQISNEAHQEIREGRVACTETDASEQSWLPGLITA